MFDCNLILMNRLHDGVLILRHNDYRMELEIKDAGDSSSSTLLHL